MTTSKLSLTLIGMTDNLLTNISASRLREAAKIQGEIERLQARLEKILSGGGRVVAAKKNAAKKKRAKRTISPEGLERIRAAQRKRWAKHKRGKK